MELRRNEDIYSNRYIISIDQIEYGNVLAVTFDDSSVTFYDPKSMTALSGVEDANTVTSLAQAGFSFPADAPGEIVPRGTLVCMRLMFGRPPCLFLAQRMCCGHA